MLPLSPSPLSLLLQLQDPQTAQRVRAIYKPRAYGDAGGWHRTPMEWVAYRLNVLLGLDYVPPVAYRQAAGGWACIACTAAEKAVAAAGAAVCEAYPP